VFPSVPYPAALAVCHTRFSHFILGQVNKLSQLTGRVLLPPQKPSPPPPPSAAQRSLGGTATVLPQPPTTVLPQPPTTTLPPPPPVVLLQPPATTLP
jgi:hypothetical protein